MSKGTNTLEKISRTGEITIPATGAPEQLGALIATELNIEQNSIEYVDDLTPQGGGLFTWSANEVAGTRYAGADWPTKKPKTTDHATAIYVESVAGPFQCDFIVYVNQMPTKG